MPRTGGTGGTSKPTITKFQFRLLALVAFGLFVASLVCSIDTHPTGATIHDLSGPNPPPDESLIIPVSLAAASLGVVVGYSGILFFVRWARLTVILSVMLLAALQLSIGLDLRSGGTWIPLALAFYIASLLVITISFSGASALFKARTIGTTRLPPAAGSNSF
jgi:hypothetical protein